MSPDELSAVLQKAGVKNIRLSGQNLMAQCPSGTHEDHHPSWGISVNHPHFHACFACGLKGTLFTLLRYTFKYSESLASDLAQHVVSPQNWSGWGSPKEATPLPEYHLYPFKPAHRMITRYLFARGISRRTTASLELYWHPEDRRVLFPWRDVDGRLWGVTGRAVDYGVQPKVLPYFGTEKRNFMYMPKPYGANSTTVMCLVEGEVDAIKVYQSPFKRVAAIGSGSFSDLQKILTLIILKPNSKVILAFDNDESGQKLCRQACEKFRGSAKIMKFVYPRGRKDPGEMTSEEIRHTMQALVFADWPSF